MSSPRQAIWLKPYLAKLRLHAVCSLNNKLTARAKLHMPFVCMFAAPTSNKTRQTFVRDWWLKVPLSQAAPAGLTLPFITVSFPNWLQFATHCLRQQNYDRTVLLRPPMLTPFRFACGSGHRTLPCQILAKKTKNHENRQNFSHSSV